MRLRTYVPVFACVRLSLCLRVQCLGLYLCGQSSASPITPQQRIGLYPSLHLVRQRDPLEVRLFASSLVEEKITAGDPYNYVDWLCFLHKEIMSKINQ